MTTLADESLTLTGPDAERSYTINDIKMKLKCPFGKHSTKRKKRKVPLMNSSLCLVKMHYHNEDTLLLRGVTLGHQAQSP